MIREAQGAASMWVSRNNGKITELASVSTIADGIAVKIPGELNRLLTLVAENGANVLSINHDREDYQSAVNACVVNLSLETRDRRHAEDILNNLQENGYPVNWIK